MKHLQFILLSFYFFSMPGLKAQSNHFIYIQTENKQSFYVKLENKLYSSSSSGYLVVPKLKDGNYNLAIGFPKSEWTEQNMLCKIDKNDAGYLLKNFGSKGWGLFNLQTLDIVMSEDKEKAAVVEVSNKTDAFSNMLSNVVNDSTIRQNEIVKVEEKKAPVNETEKLLPASTGKEEIEQAKAAPEPLKEEVKLTEAKESTIPEMSDGIKKTAAVTEPVSIVNNDRSVITRSLFNKSVDGIEMVFTDDVNGSMDTIRVFIPAGKNSVPVIEEKSKEAEPQKEEKIATPAKQEEKIKDARFLEVELPNPGNNPPGVILAENKLPAKNKDISKIETGALTDKQPGQLQNVPMINSDCKSIASEEDFLKLRKKLVSEDNDDGMITVAKKSFKARCFTVEQVKNLSVLFLMDSGKYAFFDMAYPFVSDSHNFGTLQKQLSETYYINRFEVMIRK